MELSREFVEKLSQIFFNEELNGEHMEGRLSDIFLNEEMGNNLIKDDPMSKN